MTIKDPMDQFKSALVCPFCRKPLKSTSGFTLHLKQCNEVAPNVKAAKSYKVGNSVRYQGRNHKIDSISGGLIVFENGNAAPASKVLVSKSPATGSSKTAHIAIPKTAAAWVKDIRTRHPDLNKTQLKRWVSNLYKLTGYAKYMKWTLEEVCEAALKG